MISFDKKEIKESLNLDNIFELLQDWGGDPEYTSFGIISATICHNRPGEGSKKLYFYENSSLFRCYTGCDDTFDIFELAIKVMDIQNNIQFDLNDAVRFVAQHFGMTGTIVEGEEKLQDWAVFEKYNRIQSFESKDYTVVLQEYDDAILDRLNYNVKIQPWLEEGMTQEVLDNARIGFYPGADQITIPHYDVNGRFIGLRGRALCSEEADKFGKYRPMIINRQLYNHPLGMNLYNLDKVKDNIKVLQKAIIYESEKSTLLHASYFGLENNISVACCGSNISAYQIQMLIDAGAQEIIVAFDRQFKEIGDDEFKHLTKNLKKIYNKYKNIVNISFIFDKEKLTDYKSAPIDHGPDIFLKLFKNRVLL
jgi:hypothetical protein